MIVCRTTDTTGKVVIGGRAEYTTASGIKAFDDLDNAGTEATVDTTVSNMVDVTLQWNAASTARSITATIATIMLV